MPEVGEKAPDFTLPSTDGPVTLSQVNRGKKVVLAFYTEDNTPSCTQEVASFKEEHGTIQEMDAVVLGISVDSVESHRTFCDTLGGCPFSLLSDEGLEVARLYDVLGEDGKRTRRAIYVIDEEGVILHKIPWYQPGNPGQFMEVFQALGLE